MTYKKRPKDKPEGAIEEENLVQEKPDKDLSGIVLEVREGKWGKGQERRKRLAEAGHDFREIEAEIVKQLNK
jgi:CW_7 repeat